MKSILFRDKLPYLLTILIGLAAYQINNVIQMYVDAPTLAYRFTTVNEQKVEDGMEKVLECKLSNLSKKDALRNLVINIAYKTELPDPKKVMDPEIIPIAPSTIIPDTMMSSAFGLINEYKIPVIQPNSQYVLKLKVLENPAIDEYPKLYLSSSQSVKLTDHNFEVFLITNQVIINILLLAIWLVFIIIYFFMLSSAKPQKNETNS